VFICKLTKWQQRRQGINLVKTRTYAKNQAKTQKRPATNRQNHKKRRQTETEPNQLRGRQENPTKI
jgi:hypothetical protein